MSVTPRPRLVDGETWSPATDRRTYRHERMLATRRASELSVVHVPDLDTRLVVMKRLQASLQTDPLAVDRFRHEARIAGCLDHPRIVRVLEVVATPREDFYTMEYVPGLDLHCLVEVLAKHRRRIPLDCALQIAIDACVALDYVHALADERGTRRGLVHGRLSLSKILVADTGRIKLTGFGGPPLDPVREPAPPGSHPDAARMRWPGELPDARGDVLALGLLLYQLTAGPPELEPVLRRALAHDRVLRYQSAGELQADLETVLWAKWPTASPRTLADLVALALAELGPRSQRFANGSTGLATDAIARLDQADRPIARGSAPPLTAHPTARVPILAPLPAPPALPTPADPLPALRRVPSPHPAPADRAIEVSAAPASTPGASSVTETARDARADRDDVRPADPPIVERSDSAFQHGSVGARPIWPVRTSRQRHVAVAIAAVCGLALSGWAIWRNVHEPSSLPDVLSAHPAPPADLVVHGSPAPPVKAPRGPVVPPPEVVTKPRRGGQLDATAVVERLETDGRDPRSTRRAVERVLGPLRACYRTAARAHQVAPVIALRLEFEVGRTRRPVHIHASDGGALDGLTPCATKVIAELHGLANRGARVTVDLGFRPLP